MTSQALGPVETLRHPYWMGREDRSALAEAIIYLTTHTAMFPTTKTALDAVLVELGVAEARDQMWPDRANIARRVQGHPSDYLPIRMSETERDTVLGITLLPESLRDRLTAK